MYTPIFAHVLAPVDKCIFPHHSDCIEIEDQQMHHLFPNWHPYKYRKKR